MGVPGEECFHLDLLSWGKASVERDILQLQDSGIEPFERLLGTIQREDTVFGEETPAMVFENALIRIVAIGADRDVRLCLLAYDCPDRGEITRHIRLASKRFRSYIRRGEQL